MPLSRHFYTLDEVEAALSYCSTRNDIKETVFWCQEMLHSGCAVEAISCLFQTWLWDKGPFCLGWLLDSGAALSADELAESEVLVAADRLRSCYALHDHSLWNILFLQRTSTSCRSCPDRVTPKTPESVASSFISARSPEELFFVRACYQGKAQSAWWRPAHLSDFWGIVDAYIATVLPEEQRENTQQALSLLRSYERLLGNSHDAANEILSCLAVLILCLSPEQRARSLSCGRGRTMDATAATFLQGLEPAVGRVGFRLYTVPVACLYGRTARGRTRWSETTLPHLHQIEPHLLGCPFWEEALTPFVDLLTLTEDGFLPWTSDDTMEEFYDQYFPDDIPDEWTLSEKKKSHGDGVLGPHDRVMLAKYVRLHLSKTSRLAWNSNSLCQRQLESLGLPLCGVTIMDLYHRLPKKEREESAESPIDAESLRPLRRQLVYSS